MSNRKLQIGFVGGGNMARAIIGGLLEAGHDPGHLHVSDPSVVQRAEIEQLNGKLHISQDNAGVAKHAEVLVLAVKPQIIGEIAADLRNAERPDSQLVMSIAAGITLGTLQDALGTDRQIVRVMPNQPAIVGAGMSVMIASDDTSLEHLQFAEYIGSATGRAAWVDDENLMDVVTAVSGSGPAYFYLLMEIMEVCAKQMGLPEDLAGVLTRQTGYGAGLVAAESKTGLDALRESVTSKGGTTAAALKVLEDAGIRDIVCNALKAARDRSAELGGPGEPGETGARGS
jgi:pyrroline-5-carboxylate reductase